MRFEEKEGGLPSLCVIPSRLENHLRPPPSSSSSPTSAFAVKKKEQVEVAEAGVAVLADDCTSIGHVVVLTRPG